MKTVKVRAHSRSIKGKKNSTVRSHAKVVKKTAKPAPNQYAGHYKSGETMTDSNYFADIKAKYKDAKKRKDKEAMAKYLAMWNGKES